MTAGHILYLIRISIENIIILSAPMLIIALIVGLLISIFQAITSIQDQTLSFIPKIIVILLTIVIFGPWILNKLMQFTYIIFNQLQNV
ncbi:flagellar biosynthesis protein FliQ [Borreliella yangtzensis]|uniref:Flagellar biosynthetic protein FliQ n=1 Tax=Borreliella yangtzensis TaxID=683292 RepID=A0ABR6PBP7_9SPIR|nr:flagellar biosynthesis protein FliQ [Borreliella yangtzensis]MBB6042970.1 flagellar biosynthetic protein FliQ [Borreliella yangtzensis]WKC73254.1 flagellar biosynthesis protein FliQ [Borreliella yangtzensis]WKC74172.1 flagellar biosynthesis protein FliQ [Borreliella yangtzensis]WKC75098.1 flagellar biosynthesis protein FliQ [Borreliella yangtzensis]